MRVQVLMKIQNKVAPTESKIDITVGPRDCVAEVQKRILDIQPNAFPDHKIVFNGHSLPGDALLVDCGVKEGGILDFVITPSEDAFCQQLAGFLKPRALAPQELGLLYCHKYCVTVAAALGALGFSGDFQEFLQQHKGFALEGGLVSAVVTEPPKSAPTTLDIFVVVRVETAKGPEESSVELKVQPMTTVRAIKEQISAMELLPFPDNELLLDGDVLDDDQTLSDCQVRNESRLVLSVIPSMDGLARQLVEILDSLPMRRSSSNELSSLYCYRHGASLLQALRTAGWKKGIRFFFESSPQFSVLEGGCVTLPGTTGALGAIPECTPETVEKIVNAMLTSLFLNVDHVTKGSYEGSPEIVLHLTGLPPKGYDSWKSGLLNAAACTLTDIPNLSDAEVADDALQVRAQCGTSVVVRLESTAVAWAY